MRTALVLVGTLLLAAACGGNSTTTPGDATPPAQEPPALAGASCDLQTGGDEDAAMFLTDVQVTAHPGFDRVVFEFEPREGEPAVVPFHEVGQVDPPLVEDPSGEELDVEGEAFLSAVIWASGVDLSGETFREVYTGPDSIKPTDTDVIAEVREGGDFENTMSWYVGLDASACFLVSTQSDPVRIVLDVAT